MRPLSQAITQSLGNSLGHRTIASMVKHAAYKEHAIMTRAVKALIFNAITQFNTLINLTRY